MRKKSIVAVFLIVFVVVAVMVVVMARKTPVVFTDGIITARFDKESRTLTFSGEGAVDGFGWTAMEKFDWQQAVFVQTIVFEDGITSIGECEFNGSRGYTNLKKVIFRGDINAIGVCAFSSNPNLETVEFNGKCRMIDCLAFFECAALNTINIPEGCDVFFDAFASTPFEQMMAR